MGGKEEDAPSPAVRRPAIDGLPVAEALSLGTPVLRSDIRSLRAVGKDAPDYLDPLDGLAWLRAIEDYAREDSPRRGAQLERLAAWRGPSWSEHFAAVHGVLAEVTRRTGSGRTDTA
jgi:hypothetical protein